MTKQMIQLNHSITQATGYLVSNMDGEKVMMDIESGKYYNLGNTGGIIWDIIRVPTLFTELISILTSEFEISNEDCLEQVKPFLEHMYQEQLIVISDEHMVCQG